MRSCSASAQGCTQHMMMYISLWAPQLHRTCPLWWDSDNTAVLKAVSHLHLLIMHSKLCAISDCVVARALRHLPDTVRLQEGLGQCQQIRKMAFWGAGPKVHIALPCQSSASAHLPIVLDSLVSPWVWLWECSGAYGRNFSPFIYSTFMWHWKTGCIVFAQQGF